MGLLYAILGIICAISESHLIGIFAGAVASTLFTFTWGFISSGDGSSQLMGRFFLYLYTSLPVLVIFLPVAAAFRWGIAGMTREKLNEYPVFSRIKPVVILIILAGILGTLSMYSTEAMRVLVQADKLVKAGIAANSDGSSLPKPLQTVDGFFKMGNGPYTLEWRSDVVYQGARPETSSDSSISSVVIRFDTGLKINCIYYGGTNAALCEKALDLVDIPGSENW
ncbi:MAG TPA: hypothetical protein PKW33_20025 [Anaerolineaceae bacterium]|nr:hypothetical protein [Anaerolineaceae bacterium]